MTEPKGFETPASQSEPVVGVPVNQSNARDTLAVVSDRFCVPHDVVLVLQQNINPRSTEVYNIIDSAGAPQFRLQAAVTDAASFPSIMLASEETVCN